MDKLWEKAFDWQKDQDEQIQELHGQLKTISSQVETLQDLPQSSREILDKVNELQKQVDANTRILNERRGALDLSKWATSIVAALLSSALTGTIVTLIVQ